MSQVNEVIPKCPNCEEVGEKKPSFFQRKVHFYAHETTKDTEGIAIYCGMCNRTITVLPSQLFHVD